MTDKSPTSGSNGADDSVASMFEQFGGSEFFTELVADFYRGVAADPVLRPMYPEADLLPAQHRLRLFLEQYWGGPRTYSDERGHPRLRMRHAPFPIDDDARDRWLGHMENALNARSLPTPLHDEMWRYLVMAAHSLVNRPQ